MDLGSVIRKVSIDDAEMRVLTTGQFIFSTWARAQARERGEGGPRAHKQKKVDKRR
jgi:hypothetical protein